MSKRVIDRNLLKAAWQDVIACSFQTFAYYHWWLLQMQNPSFATDAGCITIKNAALESSLMSIRGLDDFFLSKPKSHDDLVASDFGFPAGQNFLSVPERTAINKKLAHLTYQSARELEQDPHHKNPRTWNNAEMVCRANQFVLEFLDHIEATFFAGDAVQIDMVRSARGMIQMTIKNLHNISTMEMEFMA